MSATTVLGVTYAGKPMFRSLAFELWSLEQAGKPDKAQALLDAHNHMRRVGGFDPIDLAQQFTADPSSMATQCPSALARVEADKGFEVQLPDELKRTGTGGWL